MGSFREKNVQVFISKLINLQFISNHLIPIMGMREMSRSAFFLQSGSAKKPDPRKKNPKNKKYKIFLNIIFITFNTILFVRFLHNMIKEHNLDPISFWKTLTEGKIGQIRIQVFKVWLAKNLFRKISVIYSFQKDRLCLKY